MKQRCDDRPIKGLTILSCSSAPDTSGQQAAALKTAELSEEQLKWAKEIYAQTAPQRAAAEARANQVSDLQMEQTKQQMGLASEYDAYNKRVFRPLEEGIVQDAKTFDTEAERERLAGLAKGEVSLAGAAARDMGERALTRSGINPNDGAYAAMQGGLQNQITLGQAGAANKARSDAMTIGRALKSDAVALGRGLPGNAATAASLAVNAGNSSVGNSGASFAPGQQAQAMLSQAYGGARAGYGQSANIYGNIANMEAGANASGDANAAAAGSTIATIGIAI